MPIRILLVALVAMGALASPAAAAGRDEIIQDCADDGRLQGKYSQSELRDARKNMPSDVAEYTDCADVLRRAELPDRASSSSGGGSSIGGGGGGSIGGGGGGELLTPADDKERAALEKAATTGAGAVTVDGEKVTPGAAGLAPEAARNGIPTTLLIALIAIAVLGLAAAVPAVRRFDWSRLTTLRRGSA